MKTKQLLLLFAAGAVVALSCAKEPMLEIEQNGDMIPLNINSSITQKHTKATAEGFVDKDALGLFAVNYTENNTVAGTLKAEGNQADNVKYVFDEANYKWNPVKAVYYKDVNTHADLYAYYPYQANIKDVNAANFEVKKDQSTEATANSLSGYEASDFLWGKAEDITPTQSAIAISMSHKLSAVEVRLVEGTGFAKDEFASLEKSVILTSTTRKATIDYATGEATPLGGPQLDGIVMCPQTDGSWRAIVIPQAISAGAQLFSITVNGVSYKFSQQDVVTYQAGKQMAFNITVNKKTPAGDLELALADTQITDWVEDRNTHGGESRQYFVVNVTEPGTLGKTIKAMGKNPDKIKNLKVVGNVRDDDFYFMRDSMAILEAVNMKESVIKGSGKEIAYSSKTWSEYENYVLNYGEPDYVEGEYCRWIEKDGCIPSSAFQGKKSLYYFVFPEYVVEIGNSSFDETSLTNVLIIPEDVELICERAFNHTNISSVSFSNVLETIGNSAFNQCLRLSGEIVFPETLKRIGDSAFSECKLSGELILPNSLEYIGDLAFFQNRSLMGDLRIPDKITTLSGTAFVRSGFTGHLDLNNVNVIQESFYGAFEGCRFIGDLIIPEGMKIIPHNCFNGSNFTSVVFPSSMRIIDEYAFAGNNILDKLIIPEGVNTIGTNAFMDNPMIYIEIPSSVSTIGDGAFCRCLNISSIVCHASEPPRATSGTFYGVAKDNFTVEVPAQSVKKYQTESGWSDFKRIAAHYDFSVSRERMRALNAEQTRTYTLRAPANFSWSIQSKPEWVTVSPVSGTGRTYVTITVSKMDRTSETFEVNEGTYNSPSYRNYKGRSGEIIFQLDEEGVEYTCSFEVEQYDSDYSDGQSVEIQKAAKGNGIDIIFVGDGYDAKDIVKETFISNVNEGYEAFFNVEPYKTYKEYFNIYSVITQSDDSGIETPNTVLATKFGARLSSRIDIPDLEPIFSWAKKADGDIDFTKALIINLLNTSIYEGITTMYTDGSAIAFCPVSKEAYPYDFRGIIQHEAGGHGFGKLGDEYIYHIAFIQSCLCPCCEHPKSDNDMSTSYGIFKSLGWYKNLSLNADMHQVPWAHLIYNPQYSNYVDIYEGGYMHSRGMYRSEATSCMNNNIPYYSAISRQAIVERIKYCAGETFDLEDFYAKDKDTFGDITRGGYVPIDRTFGVDPMWNRGSEEGSVVYMGEHPDYSKIK